MNYVRKHAQDMTSQGLGNPAARLFSNPAGDYGKYACSQCHVL
jgi:magnesium chelatase subunit H